MDMQGQSVYLQYSVRQRCQTPVCKSRYTASLRCFPPPTQLIQNDKHSTMQKTGLFKQYIPVYIFFQTKFSKPLNATVMAREGQWQDSGGSIL